MLHFGITFITFMCFVEIYIIISKQQIVIGSSANALNGFANATRARISDFRTFLMINELFRQIYHKVAEKHRKVLRKFCESSAKICSQNSKYRL